MNNKKQILIAILSIAMVFLLAVGGISFAGDEYYDGGVISGEFGNSTSGGENGGGTGTGTDVGGGGYGEVTPVPYNGGGYTNGTTGGGVIGGGGTQGSFDVSGIEDKTYNGGAQTQNITVKCSSDSSVLAEGTDYSVEYSNNINAGTASVSVTGKGSYSGTVTKTFIINKAANTLNVTPKTVKLKAKKLKKKSQKLAASSIMTIGDPKGTLSCRILSVSKKKCKKCFKMDQAGNLTVKKKLKKGTYKIKAQVAAAGDNNYDAAAREVTFVVKVK